MTATSQRKIWSILIGAALSAALLVFLLNNANEQVRFWDPVGLAIVLGGTMASTFISFDLSQIHRSVLAFFRLFKRDTTPEHFVEQLVEVVKVLRERGVAAAEEETSKVRNPFLRMGLHMVVDPVSVEDMLRVLNWRIRKTYETEMAEAKVFYAMGSFSPAYGMLGTLVGLLGMLVALNTSDIQLIGRHMAVALITTFYGLLLAHMIFRPIALRIEQRCRERTRVLKVLADGVILGKMDRSPGQIRLTLQELLKNRLDEVND